MSRNRQIGVRVEPELAETLQARADAQSLSLSEFLRLILRQAVSTDPLDYHELGYHEGRAIGTAEARDAHRRAYAAASEELAENR